MSDHPVQLSDTHWDSGSNTATVAIGGTGLLFLPPLLLILFRQKYPRVHPRHRRLPAVPAEP